MNRGRNSYAVEGILVMISDCIPRKRGLFSSHRNVHGHEELLLILRGMGMCGTDAIQM